MGRPILLRRRDSHAAPRCARGGRHAAPQLLFLSDNGAWASSATYGQEWAETGNTPFRLFKLFTHEGGIRTPFIAHWPARIAPGTENVKQTAHVKDILPTLLDAAEVKTATPDALPITGRSFLPALLDAKHAANKPLFWERMGNSAVRDGDWKLVRFYNDARTKNVSFGPRTGAWQLFNLASDPTESNDLAANESEKAAALVSQYIAWEKRIGVVPREEILQRIPPEK